MRSYEVKFLADWKATLRGSSSWPRGLSTRLYRAHSETLNQTSSSCRAYPRAIVTSSNLCFTRFRKTSKIHKPSFVDPPPSPQVSKSETKITRSTGAFSLEDLRASSPKRETNDERSHQIRIYHGTEERD